MGVTITKCSLMSGKEHTMEIEVTAQQLVDYFIHGKVIHKAMPEVPKEHREFIMTGITPEEWDQTFANGEDEEENE